MDGLPHDPAIAGHLHARYGAAAPRVGPWSAAIDGMLRHASVRAYGPDPLPPGTLETLVAAAQSAPTSSNLQCWSVVAVQDPARRARLAALANHQAHVAQAPLFLAWVADLSRARRLGEAAGQRMEGLDTLEAFLVAAIDAALAAQNAVVAAESLGLGTVYIGALRNQPDQVAAELSLPPGAVALFGLCVGHPDPAAGPAQVKPRLPPGAVLHHETYGTAAEAGALDEYDAALASFQQAEGMAVQGWRALVLNRLGRISALHGREKLRGTLNRLGFRMT